MTKFSYMKNNEIIQMLLDDGESTAMPHQIKENPRTLALRHGNCVDKKSKTISDQKRMFNDTVKGNYQNDNEKSSNVSERLSNGFNMNKDFNFSGECFETLIDSILLCQSNYSFIIGIFFKYANFLRGHNIIRLKDFIEKKYLLSSISSFKFKLTPFLSFLILLISIIFGYLCGLIISWEVGLAVGFTILTVLFIGISLILIGTYCQEWKMALQAGFVVHNSIQSFKLWLKLFFLNPSQGNEFNSNELKFVYTHLVLSNYSNNFHAVAKLIENIWMSTEKNYNNFFIRLLKASLNQDYGDKTFKRICCLPTFVYFIVALICSLSLGTILKIYKLNLSMVFNNSLTLIAFSFFAIILFFCLTILFYLLLKLICCVLHSPTHNLKGFLKSYNIYGEASTQAFLMSEFNCVVHFLSQLDNYEGNHRSFVVTFVDATGTTDLKILVEFCSFCQILLKNRQEIPMCIIILIDNQLYGMVKSTDEIIGFIKFSKLLSLCLHFNDSSLMSIFHSNSVDLPPQSDEKQLTVKNKNPNFDNIHYVGVHSNSERFKSDSLIQKLYKNINDKDNEFQEEDITAQIISDYLIMKSKLTDYNVPCVKELVITSTFAYKLSKIQNITTDLFRLIDLVTFFYHWPFLYSWMTLFIENNLYILKKTLSLRKLYENIMRNMLQSMIEEQMILELSKLDLDHSVLELMMVHNYIGELTIEEFLILNHACHLRNIPIQNFLKEAVKKNELNKAKIANSFFDGYSDRSYSSKSNNCTIFPTIIAKDSTIESTKTIKTPKNVRKCIQNIKELFSSLILSEISLDNVVWMISQIEEISKENISKYQEKIKEINANGLVLATCDPKELRKELGMSFGDWHLFYTLIEYLKSIEETNDSNFFQEVTEPLNKVSPFNPLLLLEKKTSPLLDEDNSNGIFSEESSNKICDKSYISQKMTLNSDNDSIWKRKNCTHSSTLSKENFLSPISKSPTSSPKCLGNSLIQNTVTKPFEIPTSELSNFYSIRENEINQSLDNNTFLKRTKSLQREASFDSTTTFSTQLSSPRNSKYLYDVDNQIRTYTLPTEKSKKSALVKVKHNLGCQSYNHLQSQYYSENVDEISVDDIAVLVDTPSSKFQTYLKKTDRPYHSSLFEISASNLDKSISHEKPFKKYYPEAKKASSQSNVHKQMIKRKQIMKQDDIGVIVKQMATNSLDSHSRENMNTFSYYNTREVEPDIIFRTKYFSNGIESVNLKTNKKKRDEKIHHEKPCSKERCKKSSRSKSNKFGDDHLNYEISHSEI